MRLQIHLRPKDHELLLKTFSVRAQEMVFPKVKLQTIVVDEILWFPPFVSSITYVTFLMSVSAMSIQFVVAIKALSTETTFWVAFESCLVYRSWVIVAKPLMLLQLLFRE
jgi:hypothetical protein